MSERLTPPKAIELARQMHADQPRRLQHVLAVGATCRELADCLGLAPRWRDLITSAGYLHDLGYAPAIAVTQFHPLDGARYLRAAGWETAARLVAYHSAARYQARLIGLSLAEFRPWRGLLRDLLDYADLRRGPDGQWMTPEERLAEIVERYGPESPVSRTARWRMRHGLGCRARVEARLTDRGCWIVDGEPLTGEC